MLFRSTLGDSSRIFRILYIENGPGGYDSLHCDSSPEPVVSVLINNGGAWRETSISLKGSSLLKNMITEPQLNNKIFKISVTVYLLL